MKPTINKHSRCHRLVVLGVASMLCLGLASCSMLAPAEPDDTVTLDSEAEQEGSTDRPDDLHYNLSKLDDPEFTQTYGDGENEKIWYTAAENLGNMGKPAIPYLIEKLESDNQHEVMLALYALQLASQDPELQEKTRGNYISLPSVLNPRANRHNKAIALSWWEEYQHLWEES